MWFKLSMKEEHHPPKFRLVETYHSDTFSYSYKIQEWRERSLEAGLRYSAYDTIWGTLSHTSKKDAELVFRAICENNGLRADKVIAESAQLA